MLDPATPQHTRNLLRDLNDLLATRRLSKVKFGTALIGERKDHAQTERVLPIVARGLSVSPQVPQILFQQYLGKERFVLSNEWAIGLDDLPVDIRIHPEQVVIPALRVQ